MLAIKYFSLTEAHRFSTVFLQDRGYGWRPGWNSQALLMVATSFSHRAEMAMVRSYWERRPRINGIGFSEVPGGQLPIIPFDRELAREKGKFLYPEWATQCCDVSFSRIWWAVFLWKIILRSSLYSDLSDRSYSGRF